MAGVRTRDRGLDAQGQPKSEYEPGADVKAKVTILGEGPRGHLRILMNKYNMQEGLNEMGYEMGCKEVLQPSPKAPSKKKPRKLIAGYPLGLPAPPGSTFGGGFIYSMGDDKVSLASWRS